MRAVIQRVSEASVTVNQSVTGSIERGFLILLGIEGEDTRDDVLWLAEKIAKLRIFPDEQGLMNLALPEVNGKALVISQFTLHAKTKKGTRPSFIKAARPETAEPMYDFFCDELGKRIGKKTERGVFGAHMDVSLVNDGPVTLIIDTKNKE